MTLLEELQKNVQEFKDTNEKFLKLHAPTICEILENCKRESLLGNESYVYKNEALTFSDLTIIGKHINTMYGIDFEPYFKSHMIFDWSPKEVKHFPKIRIG